ncbi:MAG: beta-galactosidase, partial [Terriglobales bacterium]
MKLRRRRFLQAAGAAAAWAGASGAPAWAGGHSTLDWDRSLRSPGAKFELAQDGFRLDGRPFVMRSGSMHYPRVPRPYWRDRMRKLRA